MDRNKQRQLADQLLKKLKSIADYNDKGSAWMRHSREEIRKTRERYGMQLHQIRRAMGGENLSEDWKKLFDSPDILRDGSQSHVNQLRGLMKEL